MGNAVCQDIVYKNTAINHFSDNTKRSVYLLFVILIYLYLIVLLFIQGGHLPWVALTPPKKVEGKIIVYSYTRISNQV